MHQACSESPTLNNGTSVGRHISGTSELCSSSALVSIMQAYSTLRVAVPEALQADGLMHSVAKDATGNVPLPFATGTIAAWASRKDPRSMPLELLMDVIEVRRCGLECV